MGSKGPLRYRIPHVGSLLASDVYDKAKRQICDLTQGDWESQFETREISKINLERTTSKFTDFQCKASSEFLKI